MEKKHISIQKEQIFYWLVIAVCSGIAVFTRLYCIESVPYGLHIDEAGAAYDAWSLANYGVDRFRISYPVYFINFGSGQNALYTYLCMIFMKLFGSGHFSVLMIRLPTVILSLLAYFAGVYIVREAYGKKWSMVGAFIYVLLPYFIMQCRFGLESNLLVNMITLSVSALWLALKRGQKGLYVLAGILWGVTYYAYAVSYLPNTVILLGIFIYVFIVSGEKKKVLVNWTCLFILVILLGLPLALMLLINHFDLPQFQIGVFTITKLPEFRGGEVGFENFFINIKEIFKVIFFRDWLPYNAFDRFYTMYVISIPFIVLGMAVSFVESVKKIRGREVSLTVIWTGIFWAYFFMGLMLKGDGVNVNKLNGLFFAQFMFLISGLRWVVRLIGKRFPRCSYAALGMVLCLYLFSFAGFSKYYYTEYATDIFPQTLFGGTYEDVVRQLQNRGLSDKFIYMDKNIVYYFLGQEISPYEATYSFEEPLAYTCSSGAIWYYFSDVALEETRKGQAVFVCHAGNTVVREMLEDNDIKEQFESGMFVCYY